MSDWWEWYESLDDVLPWEEEMKGTPKADSTLIVDYLSVLFGAVEEWPDELVDYAYRLLRPDSNPRAEIRKFALEAARNFRKRGEKVPWHVQDAIRNTR